MKRWWATWRKPAPRVQFSIGNLLEVDVHSHLVPGVDDGAVSLEQSLSMIEQLVELGYRGAVITPHIYPGLYPNSADTLQPPFQQLVTASAERFPDFTLHLAAEYLIDESFLEAIRTEQLLSFPIGEKQAVLFEMGFQEPAPLLKEVVFEMQLVGLQPVMAHVERYPYLLNQMDFIEELHNRGVWLTVNGASLAGAYGPEIQGFAERLLAAGRIRMVCSDAHGERHLHALKALETNPVLYDALQATSTWVQRLIPSS